MTENKRPHDVYAFFITPNPQTGLYHPEEWGLDDSLGTLIAFPGSGLYDFEWEETWCDGSSSTDSDSNMGIGGDGKVYLRETLSELDAAPIGTTISRSYERKTDETSNGWHEVSNWTVSFTFTKVLPGDADADDDGVLDIDDECPATPTGAPVDTVGCPKEISAVPDNIVVDYELGSDAPIANMEVLSNDVGDGLHIVGTAGSGTRGGQVGAPDDHRLQYIPPDELGGGFLGLVDLGYVVADDHGQTSEADVTLTYRVCRPHSVDLQGQDQGGNVDGERLQATIRLCTDGSSPPEITVSDVHTDDDLG